MARFVSVFVELLLTLWMSASCPDEFVCACRVLYTPYFSANFLFCLRLHQIQGPAYVLETSWDSASYQTIKGGLDGDGGW